MRRSQGEARIDLYYEVVPRVKGHPTGLELALCAVDLCEDRCGGGEGSLSVSTLLIGLLLSIQT